jgi:hypothetical protein
MFTWICPTCKREVPPAYSECPDCAARAGQTAQAASTVSAVPAAPAAVAVAPPPPDVAPPAVPPQAYEPAPAKPVPSQVQVRPYTAQPQPPRGGLPTWLLAIVFALAFVGLGAGIYWTIGYVKGHTAPPPTVESPQAKAGAKINPFQRYIEISGVRFISEKNKPMVKFVVTNHSGADIPGLTANVTIWGRTQKSEEEAAGTFSFKTDLGPFQTRELTAPLTTKLEMVELPDWQNVSTDTQVTAPAAY